MAVMRDISKDLSESGEFVSTEGLAWPEQAKLVRAGKDGAPITDGVFPESKEFLAGYWIVDVESPGTSLCNRRPDFGGAGARRRAIEYADRSAADHGQDGPSKCRDRKVVRRTASEHLLRELAPQVLGSVIRRFHDFAAAEDAVQEALLAAALQWPRDGVPDNPRGWLIQVASRRMTDRMRSEAARRRRETEVAADCLDSVACRGR